jgi:tRNA(adenine34) deaminase
MDHTAPMEIALEEARAALAHDDIPVGAVVVGPAGEVVSRDHNRREERADPTAHAELLVIRAAAERQGSWRLGGHTMVVTLEPCAMCAGAAVSARLDRIVYGATDPKAGACWSLYNIPQDRRLNHNLELEAGIRADECSALLTEFFHSRR